MLNFYKNKKVLITGDTGFKGTWLSIIMHDIGADVIGISDTPPRDNDSFYNMCKINKDVSHYNVDIRNFEELYTIFKKNNPDIVFHLAAQPLVKKSYVHPLETFDINVMGSINIMECVRRCGSTQSLVIVTTDKVYKNEEWIWGYRENDNLGGVDPYSASKTLIENAFYSYNESYFKSLDIGAATARGGNVIGGGDFSRDRIIPDCIKSLKEGQDIILKNPNYVRPWQHVLELLEGYMLLGKYLYNDKSFSGNWNFGPDKYKYTTVQTIVDTFIKHWGSGSYIINDIANKMKETNILTLDSSKSNYLLGWNSSFSVDEMMQQTVEWYKEVLINKKDALKITRKQINNFF